MPPRPDSNEGEFIVLMTACVAPKAEVRAGLKRTDPGVRLHDYLEGLAFWLTLPEPLIGGIVFAENSNYPLHELEACARRLARPDRPVEFQSFDFPAPPQGMSYGYSEFLLVNKALEHSRLIRAGRYFIQATGRYRFPDISRLLRRLPDDFLVAVDSTGALRFGARKHMICTVGLALFDRGFYEAEISRLPASMVPAPPWNRRQFIEPVLYDALYPRRADPRIIMRWPRSCEPVGIGSNGDSYRGFKKGLKRITRAALRRLLPGLWI